MDISTGKMIKDVKKFYKAIGSIYCPSLKDNVVFNRNGWNHLIYDSHGHRRENLSLRLRLHLLPWAPEVIKRCKSTPIVETSKTSSGTMVTYYEISHLVDKARRNVIVVMRKVDGGVLHYYTIRNRRATKKPSE